MTFPPQIFLISWYNSYNYDVRINNYTSVHIIFVFSPLLSLITCIIIKYLNGISYENYGSTHIRYLVYVIVITWAREMYDIYCTEARELSEICAMHPECTC